MTEILESDFGGRAKEYFYVALNQLPTFSLGDCFNYFARILNGVSDVFEIPSWFIKLPPPSTPFDLSPPSYNEIASIINRARSSASASPLDQISIITLKRCPILKTILHNIIANCWRTCYTPKLWRAGVTVLIFLRKGTRPWLRILDRSLFSQHLTKCSLLL